MNPPHFLKIILAFITFFTLPVFAHAQLGVGTRALGMGGAYTAIADDISSQYWNPAGLTGVHHFSFQLLNLQLSLSGAGNFNDLVNHFPTNANSQAAFARATGAGVSVGEASGQTGFTFPGFALSVIPMARGVITPRNSSGGIGLSYVDVGGQLAPSNSTATLLDTYGYEIVGSMARRLSKTASVGLSLKYLNVTPNTVTVNFPDETGQTQILSPTITTMKQHATTSFGADVGGLFTLSSHLKLGVMLRNIVSTPDANLRNGPTLTVGVADHLTKRFTLAADLADIGYPVHLNIGGEWRFPGVGALRGGLYRNHPTLGVQFLSLINVAVSTDSTLISFGSSF